FEAIYLVTIRLSGLHTRGHPSARQLELAQGGSISREKVQSLSRAPSFWRRGLQPWSERFTLRLPCHIAKLVRRLAKYSANLKHWSEGTCDLAKVSLPN